MTNILQLYCLEIRTQSHLNSLGQKGDDEALHYIHRIDNTRNISLCSLGFKKKFFLNYLAAHIFYDSFEI